MKLKIKKRKIENAPKHSIEVNTNKADTSTSNRKIITRFSFATIVLATISFAITIFAIIYICIGFNIVNNSETISNISHNADIKENASLQDNTIFIGDTQNDISELFSRGLIYMLVFSGLLMLANIASFVIALKTKFSMKKKKHSRDLLTFNIANIIISLLSINFIRALICLINSIFIWKLLSSNQALLGNDQNQEL